MQQGDQDSGGRQERTEYMQVMKDAEETKKNKDKKRQQCDTGEQRVNHRKHCLFNNNNSVD